MTAGGNLRGKSGLHEARVPGNARRGQPQGKRHREESALRVAKVRLCQSRVMVKRWGKSPPRTGQPGRHGKPHPEQCRIGALRGKVCDCRKATAETSAGMLQPRGPGWQLDRRGNASGRGMVIQRGNPWTESGLQAIRANSVPLISGPGRGLGRAHLAKGKSGRTSPAEICRFAVDSARPIGKRRASRLYREGAAFPMQERLSWPNRRRSRSV